ncbi:MAG: GDSL family lipase [Streptococcus pyogenes]|nr:MAG: GDSL family lipase [Streptococcus pyogenes]
MNKKSFWGGLMFFLVAFGVSLVLFQQFIPQSDSQLKKTDFLKQKPKTLFYLALGDSLTEGVGDSTGQGGFVPLLADDIADYYHVQVKHANYGVSGNTSQQILTRMQTQEPLQRDLKKAKLLTITVGGNDVLAVIRKQLTELQVSSFDQPRLAYQERLRQIIDLARKDNADLPIYILGIYNPFYLNFPEIKDMQTVVDQWNQGTKEVTKEYQSVYFVPINDRLYRGINGQEGIDEASDSTKPVINDALFSQDHFHPNNIGYRIMSTAVMESLKKHENKTFN